MPARRRRKEEEGKGKRDRRARPFNPIPLIDIYGYPLEGLIEGASSSEEGEESETPVESTEDEDFDEGEDEHYKEQAFEVVRTSPSPPRAKLAFVLWNGEIGVAVQGLGQAIASDLRRLIIQKALTLKTIGQAIIDKYPELASLRANEQMVQGWLVQSEVAKGLKKKVGLEEETLKSRISKVINTEWAEMPSGELVPLRQFFRTKSGPAASAEEPAMLHFFSENLNLGPKSLAEDYLAKRGEQPGQSRLVGSYRKKFERFRDALLMKKSPEAENRELAYQYLASRGLKADAALTSAVAKIIDSLRGNGDGR